LLITTPLDPLIPLHLPVEYLAGLDVHGCIKHDGLLGDGEFENREGEARRWTAAEVALCGVCGALRSVAGLAAEEACRTGGCEEEGGELHGEGEKFELSKLDSDSGIGCQCANPT
jgi:hypothetical protein